jgi:hypothetical protein
MLIEGKFGSQKDAEVCLMLNYGRLELSRVPQRSCRYPARLPPERPGAHDVRNRPMRTSTAFASSRCANLSTRKSPEVKMYTQMKRTPLDRLTKGKAVLIGDACHPMLLSKFRSIPIHFGAVAIQVL